MVLTVLLKICDYLIMRVFTCMVQGLGVLGHRVMETVGRDLTDINFSRGFAIELGSTLSVVLASVAGKPHLHFIAIALRIRKRPHCGGCLLIT